jgi:hypothetical protein
MNRKLLFLLSLAFTLIGSYGGSAQASSESGSAIGNVTVLASESVLLQESGATTTSLAIPGAGELFVTLTDLQFPTSFSSLQYAVSNAIDTLVAPTNAGTTTTLDLTAPTTLYANVFATVGQGGAGLYNLTATFVSAVPLPDSIGLLASGGLLIGLLVLRRKPVRRSWADYAGDETGNAAVPG